MKISTKIEVALDVLMSGIVKHDATVSEAIDALSEIKINVERMSIDNPGLRNIPVRRKRPRKPLPGEQATAKAMDAIKALASSWTFSSTIECSIARNGWAKSAGIGRDEVVRLISTMVHMGELDADGKKVRVRK